jgi:hypothetical protein
MLDSSSIALNEIWFRQLAITTVVATQPPNLLIFAESAWRISSDSVVEIIGSQIVACSK